MSEVLQGKRLKKPSNHTLIRTITPTISTFPVRFATKASWNRQNLSPLETHLRISPKNNPLYPHFPINVRLKL
jgi:hypothetical protein